MPKQQPQQSQQHSPQPSAVEPTRRQLGRLALGGVTAMALAACGGGGGGDGTSSKDLDLRAAYERIVQGMDYDDVNKAVGVPSGDNSPSTRNWVSGGQHLVVGFSPQSNGIYLVGSVQLFTADGSELIKEFDLT